MELNTIRPKTYFKDFEGNATFFVTITCKYRRQLLSNIIEKEVKLTEVGELVNKIWSNLQEYYPQVEIGKFVLMPDHLHGIIKVTQIKDQ